VICLSVAHSNSAPGNCHFDLREYDLSQRMTASCAKSLKGSGVDVEVLDVGDLSDYAHTKVAWVNARGPKLALELHLNACERPDDDYSCVIYAQGSEIGKAAATAIGLELKWALGAHGRSLGAVTDLFISGHHDFFVGKTRPPAVIVEPLFLSNPKQAEWLKSEGSPETLGLVVASGILNWMKGTNS
jgi:N-acetylmuramoyl-L-alanine amidase